MLILKPIVLPPAAAARNFSLFPGELHRIRAASPQGKIIDGLWYWAD
jgi:hypothetical protein